MKTIMALLFSLSILLPAGEAAADFNKTKIAVLDFQMQGEPFDNEDMGIIVAEWFITAMVREGRFDVVERRLLQKILGEQQLAMTGVVDAGSATQIGKLLGVKVIITGSVMRLGEVTEINARIIDVESASIITAENVKSASTGRLQDLVVEMSKKIIRNFPLEGYVVNRTGEEVTIDLGIRTGVQKGMRFIVFKEGQVIKHPKTGEVLDVERIETGKITVIDLMQKICTAKIDEESSPGAVDYGQLVKSLIETRSRDSRLVVDTTPANARVRILNISPPYVRGMVLAPGAYEIEVSAPGYAARREWYNLATNEEKIVAISLRLEDAPTTRVEAPSTPQPPAQAATAGLNREQQKYIRMLQSASDRERKDAAKLITRAALSDTVVLDVVEQKLLQDYNTNARDSNHVDTMAWFCKALGASGQSKYRGTLSTIVNNSSNRKLRGHCQKSLDQL